MDDSQSNTRDEASRREVIAKLLGVAGAGMAISALGCNGETAEFDDDVIGQVTEAISGAATVKYADSVGELRALTGGSVKWIAVLGGYYTRGDGGGGVFYWDSAVAPDNGGTILNSGAGNSAGWRRIHDNRLNVKWFGAKGDGVTDDRLAIQNTINFVASSGAPSFGGVVNFPRGNYIVKVSSLVIPRQVNPTQSIMIHGAGIGTTVITGYDLPATTAVMLFDSGDTINNAWHFQLEDLWINRNNQGYVFLHGQVGTQRLIESSFRNVKFEAPALGAYGVVVITGALHVTFDNIYVQGGNDGFTLLDSSHCTLNNMFMDMGYAPPSLGTNNAFRIIGGGSHKIGLMRSEAVANAALTLEGTGSIVIDELFTEGKETTYTLEVYGSATAKSRDIIVKHLGIANPYASPAKYGLYCNAYAENVHVLGGTLGSWGANSGNGILVDAGAKNITVENIRYVGNVESYNIDHIVNLSGGALQTRVWLIDTGGVRWEREVGTVPALAPQSPFYFAFVSTNEVMLAGTGLVKVLKQGGDPNNGVAGSSNSSQGRRLLVIGATTGLEIRSDTESNIKLVAGASWFSGANKTIEFVFDGAWWQEVSRSETT